MAGWARVAAKTAAEVCGRFRLGPEAKALPLDGATPETFFGRLVEAKHFEDAVRLLSHALPKREALWWACQCVRAVKAATAEAEAAALAAAEQYVELPTDANRRTAMEKAEVADFGTPAGCVAAAAFFSAGSLAPADLPPVPPAEELTAQTTASAVLLTAVVTEPQKAEEKYRLFLKLGCDIAEGKNRWKEVVTPGGTP